MIRKLLRFSRVALAVVALLGLLGITLFGLFGEKVLRSEVEKRLAQTLKRPVRVGSLSVDLASRTVEIRDLEIPGGAQSPYPTLQAEKVRLALSFRSLATSKILLRRLELEKPKISIQVLPDGSTDLPEIEGPSGNSSRTVSIGAVAIRSGELRLNDRRPSRAWE